MKSLSNMLIEQVTFRHHFAVLVSVRGQWSIGSGRIMDELKASALSVRERYFYCPSALTSPLITANWCLKDLLLT